MNAQENVGDTVLDATLNKVDSEIKLLSEFVEKLQAEGFPIFVKILEYSRTIFSAQEVSADNIEYITWGFVENDYSQGIQELSGFIISKDEARLMNMNLHI